jgi:hypothetical protein
VVEAKERPDGTVAVVGGNVVGVVAGTGGFVSRTVVAPVVAPGRGAVVVVAECGPVVIGVVPARGLGAVVPRAVGFVDVVLIDVMLVNDVAGCNGLEFRVKTRTRSRRGLDHISR